MRRLSTILVMLALALTAVAKETTIQELVARADAAPPGDRPALYVEIAERQLKSADDFYNEGKVTEAQTAVQDVVTYSSKAHDAAIQSNKKLKHTELAVRQMARRMRDLKHTLNFEDQPPVQAAADRLQNLADDLLSHMFGKGK
jgi:polyhydroxyalkanoate synthesis regulator phasin